jgi:hypothetical protein
MTEAILKRKYVLSSITAITFTGHDNRLQELLTLHEYMGSPLELQELLTLHEYLGSSLELQEVTITLTQKHHDEGYSRNTLYALTLIYMLLFEYDRGDIKKEYSCKKKPH